MASAAFPTWINWNPCCAWVESMRPGSLPPRLAGWAGQGGGRRDVQGGEALPGEVGWERWEWLEGPRAFEVAVKLPRREAVSGNGQHGDHSSTGRAPDCGSGG